MPTHNTAKHYPGSWPARFPGKLAVLGAALSAMAFLVALAPGKTAAANNPFTFNDVVQKAEKLAHKPYQSPPSIPKYLRNMSYQQWQDIRFLSSKSPWSAGNNFSLQFTHLGYLYKQPVKINLINAQGVHRFRFSPQLFNYGNTGIGRKVPGNLGFAGFNVYYPLSKAGGVNEVLSFLGASYFRAAGKYQWLGLSARGIAIDTASSNGEQFPYFKEFWLVRPAPQANSMELYALLNGKSVTGAYDFVVHPGAQTVTDVHAVLFLRNKVQKFGIAPFSSMFLQGSNSIHRFTTLVPQMHNSDGLSIKAQDNRWIWRPLQNPKRLAVYSFELNDPLGFGLMQRDRKFCSYESLSLHYQDRPSAWVTPVGNWGKGNLQLIEIPTDTNNNDNIVAFWIPAHQPAPLKPFSVSYRICWEGNWMSLPKVGYVVDTRTGKGNLKGSQEFAIDFTGGNLSTLPPSAVSAVISVGKQAKLLEHHIVKNPYTHGLRLEFQIRPAAGKPVQLRTYLQKGNQVLTETWNYVFHPAS